MKKPFILFIALLLVCGTFLSQVTTTASAVATPLKMGAFTAHLVNADATSADHFTGAGAWASVPGRPKIELYIDPTKISLFGDNSFTLSQLQEISYATKKAGAQGDVDFYVNVYTRPYTGGDSSWYGNRLTMEPLYSNNLNAPANTWNVWNTNAGTNQLTWFDGNHGPIGFSGAPTLADLQAGPVTWADTKSIDYREYPVKYVVLSTGNPWAASFSGLVDGLTITLKDGRSVTVDLENQTDTVWVDDNWAGKAHGVEVSAGKFFGYNAFSAIQDGIDAVLPGGTVRVFPGSYDEKATNRFVLGTNGPHQFGLFIAEAKSGISILGVDASDQLITDYHNVLAAVATNATNNFGASGIFVEGDSVTIQGLKILPNVGGDNKTIEAIGDDFKLLSSHLDIPDGGSVYLNDWRFDRQNQASHVNSYQIVGNLLDHGTSVDICNGAGFSGDTNNRIIRDNQFNADGATWAVVSFTGSGTPVPWFVDPIGGAIITGNHFAGTGVQYIRARGDYDLNQFNWASYWNDNTFDKAVIVGTSLPGTPRAYSYTSGSYVFQNVRRIGATIQGEIDNAQDGDTVLVKAGVYPESPNVTKSLTLRSESGRDQTRIQLQTGASTYLGSLTLDAANITVEGFTIRGFDTADSIPASTNIYLTLKPDQVRILNNRIQVGNIGPNSNGDDGFGLISTYFIHADAKDDVDSLLVQGNIFEPVNDAGGWRAFYINPGVNQFTFKQNTIQGTFGGSALTQARNGLVEENTITGTGSSAGFGTWGYPTPTVYGKTTFQRNVISGTVRAFSINSTENVLIQENDLRQNGTAVRVSLYDGLTFNPATVQVIHNSIVPASGAGLANETGLSGLVDARLNWWGAASGPKAPSNPKGTGSSISGSGAFDAWLCDGTDSQPEVMGFQPAATAQKCTNTATRLVFSTQPSNGIATVALPTQPVVRAEGANGEVVINFSETVTLLMANNPGGAILSGTTSRAAVNGAATFSGLSLNQRGTGYSLLAFSDGLATVSNFFNILPYEADLQVTHGIVPAAINPRANLTMTLTVSNQGPADAANLRLSDTLPDGSEFVSAAGSGWTCTHLQGVVSCTASSLAAGANSSVSIVAKMRVKPGSVTNLATVSSGLVDPASANNESSASTIIAGVPVTGGLYYLPFINQ